MPDTVTGLPPPTFLSAKLPAPPEAVTTSESRMPPSVGVPLSVAAVVAS